MALVVSTGPGGDPIARIPLRSFNTFLNEGQDLCARPPPSSAPYCMCTLGQEA